MAMVVDPGRGEAIWEQIVRSVMRDVGTGRLVPGDRLPSVRELARDLVVNPNTVARAYRELERAGVVATRRGAGTFVAERRFLLSDAERRRRLGEALDALLTEATHLGFSEAEVRSALDAGIEPYRRGLGREET